MSRCCFFAITALAMIFFNEGTAQSPKKPKRDVPADNELRPVAELKLNATVACFLPSKDGTYLHFLNKSDGKIQRIHIAKKALDATEVELTEGTVFCTMVPGGRTIYACASPNGHNAYVEDAKQTGKVQAIDVEKMQVTSTFVIKFDPFEMAANDSGQVYITGGSGQWSKLVVVDIKKKSIVGQLAGPYMGSNLRMTPEGKRLYFSTNGLSPGSMEAVWLGSGGKTATGRGAGGGPFNITPDGKFIIFRSGLVTRIGKSPQDDMKEAGKVSPNRAAVMDLASKTIWLATHEGNLEKWSYPDFELQESFTLPKRAYELYLDGKTKMLFSALDNKKDRQAFDRGAGVGNIAVFDLNKK